MPVYKNTELTHKAIKACVEDIKRVNARLIIINDCSPEASMREMLSRVQGEHPENIHVETNSKNLGFVKSVNKGILLSRNSDVVLLNSDVIAPNNWLTTLLSEAEGIDLLGTLTPLSNNSTISSLPRKNEGSDDLLAYDVNTINESLEYRLPIVATPSGIGFCMLITSKCIQRVGLLNEEAFGTGYGEENDFCQRALKLGFFNFITPNLYLHHVGSISFGASAKEKIANAMKVLPRLHPNYHADVQSWILRDPLKSARIIRCLQISRSCGIPSIVQITHDLGGGTWQHVETLINQLGDRSFNIILKGKRREYDQFKLIFKWGSGETCDQLEFEDPLDVIKILDFIRPNLVHLHHMAGLSEEIIDWIITGKQCPVLITYHDFYFLKGNPSLTSSDGEYAGPNAASLEHPINEMTPSPLKEKQWLAKSRALNSIAALNIYPSYSTQRIYSEFFDTTRNSKVIPHEVVLPSSPSRQELVGGRNYTIGVLGAVSKEKGCLFLNSLANLAVKTDINGSKITFKVIGYMAIPSSNIYCTGPYQREDLSRLIKAENIDAIFFPARWPETYSYTLSTAIECALPIIAPSIGAFQERLTTYQQSLIYNPCIESGALLGLIVDFLEKVPQEKFTVSHAPSPFYENNYINFCRSFDSYGLDIDQSIVNLIDKYSQRQYSAPGKTREQLLRIMLTLYRNPLLAYVFSKIPLRLLRKIKEAVYPYSI
jgi:GT2 family glycosyltransferase/glycosyltransferase involved in cell wall biosynthesis